MTMSIWIILYFLLLHFCCLLQATPLPYQNYFPDKKGFFKSRLNVLEESAKNKNYQKFDSDAPGVIKEEPTTTEQIPSTDDTDEDMETADMIIFRPLFVYKKKTGQRYRINANRRYYRPAFYRY